MKNLLPGILLSLLMGNFSLCPAQTSASSAGTSSALFLRSTVSTRIAGMAEAFVAIADDENAILYNPAGLARLTNHVFALNHTEWLEDIRFANLIYAHNISNGFTAAVSIAHMYMPEIPRIIDANGTQNGSINVSSTIIDLATGYHLFRGFYIGGGFKYFQDNLAGNTAHGFAFDAGLYSTTFLKGLSFGASVQNIGAKIKYIQSSFKIPFTYRAGFAYDIGTLPFQIDLDAVKSVDSDINFNLGVEYSFNHTFFLLVGNHFRKDSYFTPAFGVGFKYDNRYSLYYSFSDPSEIGFSHRIGIKFEFGFSSPSQKYFSSPGNHVHSAPKGLSAKISNGNIFIHWLSLPNTLYNVYAKNADNKWIKITKDPVHDNYLLLKNPKEGKAYTFCVTAINDNIESSYSKEVVLYVKK